MKGKAIMKKLKNRKYVTHRNVIAASSVMVLSKLAQLLRVFRYRPK